MAQLSAKIGKIHPMIKRYGLALLSVVIALAFARLLASYNFKGLEFSLFLFAIALTAW